MSCQRGLDSGHHRNVVGETKHASIRLHIITLAQGKCRQTCTVYRHTHFLCLLLHFCSGSTAIIWRYSAPVGAVRLHIWKKRKTDRWYLPGWCVWPVRRTNTSDTSPSRWGRCLCRERQSDMEKKKKKDEGGRRSITPWHPVLTFCLSNSNLCCSNPWKQTSVTARWNILKRIAL